MLMKVIVPGLVLLLSVAITFAAETNVVDKVQFQGGQVLTWPGGKALLAPHEASLPFDVIVKTNGTFTVQRGKLRVLLAGESISKDGSLTKSDGTTQPVMDHVTLRRGLVTVVKDGEPAAASGAVPLADGTTIYPDGKVTSRSGASRRLLDGEVFRLQGGELPARDTITLQDGRVKVQKDGTLLTVEPGRSIMMNDGTKVFGDGKIIKADGTTTQLVEGKIFVIEGVVTRPR